MSGSTSRSKRWRKASRAGRVRALRSRVRAQEISAAIRWSMFLDRWHHLRLAAVDKAVDNLSLDLSPPALTCRHAQGRDRDNWRRQLLLGVAVSALTLGRTRSGAGPERFHYYGCAGGETMQVRCKNCAIVPGRDLRAPPLDVTQRSCLIVLSHCLVSLSPCSLTCRHARGETRHASGTITPGDALVGGASLSWR